MSLPPEIHHHSLQKLQESQGHLNLLALVWVMVTPHLLLLLQHKLLIHLLWS
jgi:hypothetical protein